MPKRHVIFIKTFTIFTANAGKTEYAPEFEFEKF